MRALERHETQAHAIPSREMRDLGDAYVLYDARDRDPFWNRMASVRWPDGARRVRPPADGGARAVRVLGRVPHIWPSPRPLRARGPRRAPRAHGFSDAGEGHVMVLEDPARGATGAVRPSSGRA